MTAAVLLAAGGCSTVVMSDRGASSAAAVVERDALTAAAAAVSDTPWPRTGAASFADRLSGSERRPGRTEAATIYVASISGVKKPVILAAAAAHAESARRLAVVADSALEAIRPLMTDVAVVEDAIGELKDIREIYVEALKLIARQGEPVDAEEIRRVRGQFTLAIRELGAAADALAERADRDPTRTYAGPPARFVN
jgi:hypothetical protein